MRFLLLIFAGALFGQQPILYQRASVNAASFAPFGLPNASIALGSIFTIFGEELGPSPSPSLSFPLSATLAGVSLSVTQNGVTKPAYPIYVSPGQVNAIMPSTFSAGAATLRLTYQGNKSNAITIFIGKSTPGIFAVSNGGFGFGVVQNYVTSKNQPYNSLVQPAAPGQIITIWATGLGPVTFPDNVAPTPGNVATPVTATIGGVSAKVSYSGRSPCCAGVDQIVATIPAQVPLGCWVPISINAGGVVSNTVTMAIAAAGAASCDDPGNPLSKLVRTPGTQAFIHVERGDSIENVNTNGATHKILDSMYTSFYTRPNSATNFDPYLSFPPPGTCLVLETQGDATIGKTLPGVLLASASLSPQPKQSYSNGTQSLSFAPTLPYFSSMLGGTIDAAIQGMNLLGATGSYTIDPGGPNQQVIPFHTEAAPSWARPSDIIVLQRSAPLPMTFTPGDSAAPTAILLYSYAAATNSTVQVECLAAPGASAFTIPADSLANLQPTYGILDGSYADLEIGTIGLDHAVSFSNGLASNGILLNSSWVSQMVVLQ
jgi:uncharacterized protein (TIGR03437 family)